MMRRSLRVLVEGPHRANKVEILSLVEQQLDVHGYKVDSVREPSNGEIGALLRRTLGKYEGLVLEHLLKADRADLLGRTPSPRNSQHVVLCDRYVPAAFGLSPAEAGANSVGKPPKQPDLVIMLQGKNARRSTAVREQARLHDGWYPVESQMARYVNYGKDESYYRELLRCYQREKRNLYVCTVTNKTVTEIAADIVAEITRRFS